MAKGEQVARLPVSALQSALGDYIEVRKSQVPGKKYPLYMVTPWGPWPINTANGQDFLLENALFNGAPVPVAPEVAPEKVPEVREALPGIGPVESPGSDREPSGGSGAFGGWLSGLGNFD